MTGGQTLVLARLFDFVTRQLHLIGHRNGLYPVQWTLLRYLDEMPADHRTASAMARYHQFSTGAVTRSVRALIQKGLVAKQKGLGHHRSEMLTLTDAGKALLADDPLLILARALADVDAAEASALTAVLPRILAAIQHEAHGGDEEGLSAFPALQP